MKAKHGYRKLTGIDYSAASVELARNILQAEDLTDVTVKVSLIIFVFRLWYPDITLALDRLSTVLVCAWKWENGMSVSLSTFRCFASLACRYLFRWIASKGLWGNVCSSHGTLESQTLYQISVLASSVCHDATSKHSFSIIQWQHWHTLSCTVVLINQNFPWCVAFSLF